MMGNSTPLTQARAAEPAHDEAGEHGTRGDDGGGGEIDVEQARTDEAGGHQLGHEQQQHRDDDGERAQAAGRSGRDSALAKNPGSECAPLSASRGATTSCSSRQPAPRPIAKARPSCPQAKIAPASGQEKRGRYGIGGDRQAAEQRRDAAAGGRIPAPSARAAATAMPSAQ